MVAISAHFTEKELEIEPDTPVAYRSNAARLVREIAEPLRAILRVPVIITDGYNPPDPTDPPGRVATSQHHDATAFDGYAKGLSLQDVAMRVDAARAAGTMPTVGEFIYYPYTTGHFHVSLPTRKERNDYMVKLGGESGGYATYSAATFPGGKFERRTGVADRRA